MPMRAGSGAARTLAALCLAWLTSCTTTVEPESTRAFDCGHETDEITKWPPGRVLFAVHDRRIRIAGGLRANGNHDLADRFRECAFEALRRAAELDEREAQYRYAIYLMTRGGRTRAIEAEAYGFFQKAAARGHKRAKVAVEGWPAAWGR